MAGARTRFFDRFPDLAGQKIVLYAPTFRGYGRSKHLIEGLDAPALRSRLPEDWALVYKAHPVVGD